MTDGQIRATVVAISLGWLFSAVDIILLILFQNEIASDLHLDLQTVRVAIGVGLLGSAVGGLFFAQLGDRWGRVKALSASIIVYSVATGLMAFTQSSVELLSLRFIAGIGTGAEWSVGFALLSEVWSPKSRGAIGGLVASMFNIGTFLAIGLFQSPLGWRASFGVMATPAIFAIVLRRLIPESPVWLDYQEAKRRGTLKRDLVFASQRSPIVSALSGPVRWTTIKLTLLFAVMNLGFYSFSTEFINYLQSDIDQGGLALSKSAQLPFQLTLNGASLLAVIVAGWLSDRLGRRRAALSFCLLGMVGFAWLSLELSGATPAELSAHATHLTLPFAVCCIGFGINGVMGIFAPELFPTPLRSTCPGVSQNLGKGVGGLMGPPLAGMLVVTQGYHQVLSYPGWLFLLIALLVYSLPEVGGRALDEHNSSPDRS